ncbi:MAG TPA: MFS transporter [Jatrophihabitans sp.]|nr:MFS transporter [Jatrophihabitans sp.]
MRSGPAEGQLRQTRRFDARFGVWVLGYGLSEAGDRMYITALVAWLYLRTGSGTLVGLVVFAAGIGGFLGATVGGWVVDSLTPRGWLVRGSPLAAGAAALLVVVEQPVQIALVAAVLGALGRSLTVAWLASLPAVTDRLTTGTAVAATVRRLAQLAGPLPGGLLVAAHATGAVYLIDAATFLVTVPVALCVVHRPVSAAGLGKAGQPRLADFAGYVRSCRVVTTALLIQAALGAILGANNTGLIALLRQRLSGDSTMYGALVTATATGLVAGALTGTRAMRWRPAGTITALAMFVVSVSLAAVTLADRLWLALGLRVSFGWAIGWLGVVTWAVLQEHVAEQFRGRTFGLVRGSQDLLIVIVSVLAGIMIDRLGAAAVFVLASGVALGCAGWLSARPAWADIGSRAGPGQPESPAGGCRRCAGRSGPSEVGQPFQPSL